MIDIYVDKICECKSPSIDSSYDMADSTVVCYICSICVGTGLVGWLGKIKNRPKLKIK